MTETIPLSIRFEQRVEAHDLRPEDVILVDGLEWHVDEVTIKALTVDLLCWPRTARPNRRTVHTIENGTLVARLPVEYGDLVLKLLDLVGPHGTILTRDADTLSAIVVVGDWVLVFDGDQIEPRVGQPPDDAFGPDDEPTDDGVRRVLGSAATTA